MANRKRDAGREALEKKGWWRSHRWLVLRRLCQFFVLGMFLSGPWFGVWILHGNYSSSLLFDTVPLTDPLMTLQSLASGHLPATVALTGAVIITVLYALAGKRLFCSWVCPLNPITDLANWLRRRFDLNQSATIPRHIRYVLLVVILLGSALTGTLIWEWINPVSLMGRSLVMGFGSGALLILALFLFDLLVVEHGWWVAKVSLPLRPPIGRNVTAVWIVFMFARNRMCYVPRCWMNKARCRSPAAIA